MRASDVRSLLPNKNQDRFFDHWNLRSDIRLNPLEQSYVNFFYLDTSWAEVNLAWLLDSQKDGKLSAESCLKMISSLTAILFKLTNQVGQSIPLDQDQTQRTQGPSGYSENSITRISRVYFRWTTQLLKATAHVLVNLLNCHSSKTDNEKHCNSIQSHLAPHLKSSLLLFSAIILRQMQSPSADSLPPSEAVMTLMYILYVVKLVSNGPIDEASLQDILNLSDNELDQIEAILIFIKKRLVSDSFPNLKGVLILVYDWLVGLHPLFMKLTDINAIALNLQKPEVSDDAFVLAAHFFIRLCKSITRQKSQVGSTQIKKIFKPNHLEADKNRIWTPLSLKEMISRSHLMDCLSKTERFRGDGHFESKRFYESGARVKQPGHFKIVLELLVSYLKAFPETKESCNFVFAFINKHFNRILSILCLSAVALQPKAAGAPQTKTGTHFYNEQQQNSSRIVLPFKTLGFIEELDSICSLLALLSYFSDFWKLRQRQQFNVLNSVLLQRTVQIFVSTSSGLNHFKRSYGSVSASHLLEQIIPVSKHEKILRQVAISRRGVLGSNLLPPINSSHYSSINKKASMRTEIQQFSNFKKHLVNASQSEDLFQLRVDLTSIQICFNFLTFLTETISVFDLQAFVPKPSGNL